MPDLAPGLRFEPSYLDRAAQEALRDAVMAALEEAPPFRPRMPRTGQPFSVQMSNCGPLGWVSDVGGYRYQPHHPDTGRPWPPIPAAALAAWRDLAACPSLPEACLVNLYDPAARMGLHQDRDEAEFGAPVLSISLGDTAVFRFGGTARKGPTRSIRLQSGDVILLGGPARLAFHGIDRVLGGSSTLLPGGGRINLTLRRVNAAAPAEGCAMPQRCEWPGHDPLYCAYHDTEWGVPETDGRALWEKLVLDGFQAGLSWITILRKRDNFRQAFHDFDPEIVARYGEADVARLVADAGIIRSRAKIEATIGNARAYLRLRDEGQDFGALVWSTIGGLPIHNAWRKGQVPVQTPLSQEMSKLLKARGFKFVGPVIVYAWMQATGQINDHVVECFRYAEVKTLWCPPGRAAGPPL